jgi:hypothetical protein
MWFVQVQEQFTLASNSNWRTKIYHVISQFGHSIWSSGLSAKVEAILAGQPEN